MSETWYKPDILFHMDLTFCRYVFAIHRFLKGAVENKSYNNPPFTSQQLQIKDMK